MNIKEIIDAIQQDPALKPGEKLVVCLNRNSESMLEDAFLLTAGGTSSRCAWRPPATATRPTRRRSRDGEELAAFHLTRSSRIRTS